MPVFLQNNPDETIKALLRRQGQTPLHKAALDRADISQFIKDNPHLNANARDCDGHTPRDLALKFAQLTMNPQAKLQAIANAGILKWYEIRDNLKDIAKTSCVAGFWIAAQHYVAPILPKVIAEATGHETNAHLMVDISDTILSLWMVVAASQSNNTNLIPNSVAIAVLRSWNAGPLAGLTALGRSLALQLAIATGHQHGGRFGSTLAMALFSTVMQTSVIDGNDQATYIIAPPNLWHHLSLHTTFHILNTAAMVAGYRIAATFRPAPTPPTTTFNSAEAERHYRKEHSLHILCCQLGALFSALITNYALSHLPDHYYNAPEHTPDPRFFTPLAITTAAIGGYIQAKTDDNGPSFPTAGILVGALTSYAFQTLVKNMISPADEAAPNQFMIADANAPLGSVAFAVKTTAQATLLIAFLRITRCSGQTLAQAMPLAMVGILAATHTTMQDYDRLTTPPENLCNQATLIYACNAATVLAAYSALINSKEPILQATHTVYNDMVWAANASRGLVNDAFTRAANASRRLVSDAFTRAAQNTIHIANSAQEAGKYALNHDKSKALAAGTTTILGLVNNAMTDHVMEQTSVFAEYDLTDTTGAATAYATLFTALLAINNLPVIQMAKQKVVNSAPATMVSNACTQALTFAYNAATIGSG